MGVAVAGSGVWVGCGVGEKIGIISTVRVGWGGGGGSAVSVGAAGGAVAEGIMVPVGSGLGKVCAATVGLAVGLGALVGTNPKGNAARQDSANTAKAVPARNITISGKYDRYRLIRSLTN